MPPRPCGSMSLGGSSGRSGPPGTSGAIGGTCFDASPLSALPSSSVWSSARSRRRWNRSPGTALRRRGTGSGCPRPGEPGWTTELPFSRGCATTWPLVSAADACRSGPARRLTPTMWRQRVAADPATCSVTGQQTWLGRKPDRKCAREHAWIEAKDTALRDIGHGVTSLCGNPESTALGPVAQTDSADVPQSRATSPSSATALRLCQNCARTICKHRPSSVANGKRPSADVGRSQDIVPDRDTWSRT